MKVTKLLIICLVAFLSVSCEDEVVEDSSQGEETRKLTRTYSQIPAPYRSAEYFSRGVSISTYGKENSLNEEDYWALAECDCYFTHKGRKFMELVESKGVLPEVKTSPIRDEIMENDLLKVADGVLGNLGRTLANAFVSDETVNESIVEGVNEGMWNTVPKGTNITNKRLRLDAFAPWYKLKSNATSFSVSEQSAKWLTIFSIDELFTGKSSKIYRDHGLQVFHVLRTLVELQYAFGIDGYNGTGLALNPSYQFGIGPYDPRSDEGPGKTLSGSYKISFDAENSLLKQAISEVEHWEHGGEDLTLEEQTRLWMTMAYVFKNLRPNNRAHIQKMFDDNGGLIPTDSHLIALTVLPSLSDILSDKLVDQDNRVVRGKVDKYGVASGLAKPVELARLMNSVQLWASELSDLSDVDVSPELLDQLKSAVPSFKDVVRLSVQHMINHYLKVSSSGEVSVVEAVDYNLAEAGEIVEALLKVNANFIESSLLNELSIEVARTYLTYTVSVITNYPNEIHFADVIWVNRVLDQLSNYNPNALGMSWLPEVKSIISAYISK